jgi:exportin-1
MSILDFSGPLDIAEFDAAVSRFYGQANSKDAQNALVEFQDHPLAWTRFADILDHSSQPASKLIALNVLDHAVRYKWPILADVDRAKVKTYAVNFISTQARNGRPSTDIISRKMACVLVQILKHEWPQNWPDFIPSLIQWSRESDLLCENALQILLLLSEEVFDFGAEQITSTRKAQIQQQFNNEFSNVFALCQEVLGNTNSSQLVDVTLQTLLRFLKWIPLAYVFESNLIEILAMKFFPEPVFRNRVLECLTEIVSLDLASVTKVNEYVSKLLQMYNFVTAQICQNIIQPSVNIAAAYDQGETDSQAFVQYLSNFTTACLRNHIRTLESANAFETIQLSLDLILRISVVDDAVIFKICLDFWHFFVGDLYEQNAKQEVDQFRKDLSLNVGILSGSKKRDPRVQQYAQALSSLRLVMISKMAKPEEVTIVENENGEVVRETLKDTDQITLYRTMKETLVFLTHLDPDETPAIMLTKLEAQVDGSEYSWHNLNTLCWAIGSISGALSERSEKHFLVNAIRSLLTLCEMKKGKNHKAIIASNIMYVVGQYPRFLKNHWRFLKTVVNKLIEFMHEKFEGVQEMVCLYCFFLFF